MASRPKPRAIARLYSKSFTTDVVHRNEVVIADPAKYACGLRYQSMIVYVLVAHFHSGVSENKGYLILGSLY